MSTSSLPLPGSRRKSAMLDRLIRVNHAGEYGAARIYAGQLAVLKNSPAAPVIEHMAAQEKVHLETFETLMQTHQARPSLLHPFWHVAGFALGAGTALLGEKAAMACTVAVESVIGEHYQQQEAMLTDEEDAPLRETIAQFRAEEMEHHDTGLAEGAEQTPFYRALTSVIKAKTKLAIWVASRV